MREIKFRIIWKGKVYYWGYVEGGFAGITTTNDGLNLEKAKELSCQFTGLKDKNGKEIYEGDIVRFVYQGINHYYLTGIMVWRDMFGEWCIEFYQPNLNQKSEWCNMWASEKEFEVIGNVFENKELLKGATNAE